ncbi:T-complex protein 1 subunit gamma [Glycine soja]|uniref:T-complex protein 1 subunit gamma n=1 Tax=Glycine soja TaxID=3848 RepID=A0A445L7Q9_GLYSO|nr:T-complex protein 1 subunit gamma [Glycine soja]
MIRGLTQIQAQFQTSGNGKQALQVKLPLLGLFEIIVAMFCYLMGLWDPGYYEDGEFGIRLENVLIVKEADTNFNFGDKGYLSFEHITWAIADIIRTTLGPRFMLKMLFDASGGIMVTNDGNAILREIDLAHPTAKAWLITLAPLL